MIRFEYDGRAREFSSSTWTWAMRFSLRSLIAWSMLVAAALLAGGGYYGVQKDRQRIKQLESEMEPLANSLLVADSRRHENLRHSLEGYAELQSLKQQAIQHAAAIRDRYSGIEKRGPDAFSIRRIPELRVDRSLDRRVFKLMVPETRQIWLKFAVHPSEARRGNGNKNDQYNDWLRSSPLTDSGPLQFQLPPGEQLLTIQEQQTDGWRAILLKVGEQTLFETRYLQVSTNGFSASISATEQVDVGPTQELPWLLSVEIEANSMNVPFSSDFSYSIWLSDKPSQFETMNGGRDE